MNALAKTPDQLAEMASDRLSPVPMRAANSEPTNLMAALVAAASNRSTDVATMERIFAMHKEIRALDAEAAFNGALARAQGKMPPVIKDSHNSQTSSNYAKLAAINRVAKPAYTSEGLGLSFDETESPTKPDYLRYLCIVTHEQGHQRTYHIDLPADDKGIAGKVNKTVVHGLASSSSYAQRILTKRVFNIAEEEDDDDGNAAGGGAPSDRSDPPVLMTEDHAANVETKCAGISKTMLGQVLKHYKVEKLTEIPDKEYAEIIRRLDIDERDRANAKAKQEATK